MFAEGLGKKNRADNVGCGQSKPRVRWQELVRVLSSAYRILALHYAIVLKPRDGVIA